MASVQATYRARATESEQVIDLTRPAEASLVRRHVWAVALVTAGAGLLGFVIGGLSEPGYTATASIELATDSPAEETAVRRVLRAPELRAEVASDLGTTPTRLRPITALEDAGTGTVTIEVSGRSRSRVEAIASLTVQRAAELRRTQVAAAHEPRLDGVREYGMRPMRMAITAAGAGLVLSLCLLFVLTYLGLVGRRASVDLPVRMKEI